MESQIEVPLLDLKAQYAGLKTEISEAINEVCESQHFIMGPKVTELEQRIAAYCQCEYAIGVSSGSDALLAALMALDIGPGDEVITSPYTFFATGGAIARVGARPVFCDIDPVSYNLAAGAVSAFIGEHCTLHNGQLVNNKTGGIIKALIPVHLFGMTADMDPLLVLARNNHLRIIEDAAQAIGSGYVDGRRAGTLGDIACFSFFPSKNLGAFGDAGMCTTNDPDLAERLRILRVHGGKPKYYHSVIGGNFRLDALQAAVLSVKLNYLDEWTQSRQENARFYDEAFARPDLADYLSTPTVLPGYLHIYNQYVVRVRQRDELKKFLAGNAIGSEIYYPVPLHMQQCFAYLNYLPEDCPESRRAAEETLALPVYPELSGAQKQHVVNSISAFYR